MKNKYKIGILLLITIILFEIIKVILGKIFEKQN